MASAPQTNGSGAETNGQLKRLGFVHSAAEIANKQAETIYKSYKSMRPEVLKTVEEAATARLVPVVSAAADTSDKLLHFVDGKVDKALNLVNSGVETGKSRVSYGLTSVKELHSSNVKAFSQATTSYFDMLARAGDWAAARLNPVTGAQTALETLKASIAKAKEMADPDVAVKTVHDAWTSFASIPAVHKVLETAEPATKLGISAFNKAHDTIVHNSLYKKGIETGASTLSWAATTTPYKLGAQYLYPWVSPIADPALEKLHASKVINDITNYWKPVATA